MHASDIQTQRALAFGIKLKKVTFYIRTGSPRRELSTNDCGANYQL